MENELRAPRDGIVERVDGRGRPDRRARRLRWSCSGDRGALTRPPRPTGGEGPDPARDRWRETLRAKALQGAPERREPFETSSGIVIRDLYTPADTAGLDEDRDLGRPGEYPFTRGVQPTMYRSRFWTMRQYAGFATAEETNRASATSSSRARRGCRSPSTCRPRWATTPTRPRRRARSAGSACRSRAWPTWRSCSTACRSARSAPR